MRGLAGALDRGEAQPQGAATGRIGRGQVVRLVERGVQWRRRSSERASDVIGPARILPSRIRLVEKMPRTEGGPGSGVAFLADDQGR